MTSLKPAPVEVDGDQVSLNLTVISRSLATTLEPIEPRQRSVEVSRLLELGAQTAQRIDQRADQAALGDMREALAADLAVVQERITGAVGDLSRLATEATDRLGERSDRASRSIVDQIRTLPQQVRSAVAAATSDTDLARLVAEVLTGTGSPIEQLERRLVAGIRETKTSHDAALTAAVEQLTVAVSAIGRFRGAMDERDRSPAGGIDYEMSVENHLAAAAARRGDVMVDVRHQPGNGGSKKGDYLAEVSHGQRNARVAVELKRTGQGLSADAAVSLVDAVIDARHAHAVLVVCSSSESMPAGLRNGETIGTIGSNGLAVCFPPDGDPAVLAVAYALVRAMATQAAATGDDEGGGIDPVILSEMLRTAKRRLDAVREIEKVIGRARNDLAAQLKALKTHRTDLAADLDEALTAINRGVSQ